MSAGPDPRVDSQLIEQERRKLTRRLDEVEKMCESTAPPGMFYGEMLKRLLESLAAPAGVVWTRTAQGNLQLQFQINLGEVGLDRTEEARSAHDELLRAFVTQQRPQPLHLPPRSGIGPREEGQPAAGNPTDYLLLLVPILHNEQVVGIIEVWQAPNRPASAVPGFLQYMSLMANLCGRYQRHQMLGQMVGQQQLWTQMEAFARQIHGSLNPMEVSFQVANEGRRLIECDRLSVAVRYGPRVEVEAVSGSDTVEKRSNEVRRLRALCQSVLDWGEKLVFTGVKDDSLPPKVLDALDDYLAERPGRLVVVQPLRDEREGEAKSPDRKPPRSVLVMECFDPSAEAPTLLARMEVVGKHASSALYNAAEHKRIPFGFIWRPLAALQEGLGGQTRAIIAAIVAALSLLISAMIFLPYPLKMEGTGKLEPTVRRIVYAPMAGTVMDFDVEPGEEVDEKRVLGRMFDITLQTKLNTLIAERDAAAVEAEDLENRAKTEVSPTEKASQELRAALKRNEQRSKDREIRDLINRTGAIEGQPGYYRLLSPEFTTEEARGLPARKWTVLTGSFREEWRGKEAKPSDPILRLGAKEGPWEIELKIPQKHIGQVLRAFDHLPEGQKELEVDFLLRSDPTRVFKGKLHRDRIAGEATPNRDDNNESEPVVLTYVRITGDDIAEEDQLPPSLLYSGTEVTAKVRCGSHRMGYSLLYGVWEFLYEKVVFFF